VAERSGAPASGADTNEQVRERIRRGRLLLDSAVVAVVLTVAACVPAVLLHRDRPAGADGLVQTIASDVLVGCLAVGLPLCGRAVRGLLARLALLVGGAVAAVGLLAALLTDGTAARLAVVVTGALTGALVVPAALALGRGWRSVYWARLADVVEGLAVGLALPAGLLAAGAFEYVRQLVS
jgi:hypothetical protein